MLDYLYELDVAGYSFVRVPKLLLQHERYQRITPEAKPLYSLLLDRVGISLKSGWKDAQNRIYIIYPIAEIMKEMTCGKNKAVQLMDELEEKAGPCGAGRSREEYLGEQKDPGAQQGTEDDGGVLQGKGPAGKDT